MRARLLFAAICIVTFPFWSSLVAGDKSQAVTPYISVAYAGHTIPDGRSCQCGAEGCGCDPGEQPLRLSAAPSNQPAPSAPTKTESNDINGAGLGLLAFTLILLWLRLKA